MRYWPPYAPPELTGGATQANKVRWPLCPAMPGLAVPSPRALGSRAFPGLTGCAIQWKRPLLPERYIHSLRFFLADMPPVKSLTTFYVEEDTLHAVTTVHGSYHQCTMRGHLCEETHARSRTWVSGRGRLGRAHDATQRSAGRRRPEASPAVSRSTRSDGERGYALC